MTEFADQKDQKQVSEAAERLPAESTQEALQAAQSQASQEGEQSSHKMAQYDETFITLEPGQIINGTVIQINPDEVMVDVGYKSEGRIPLRELGLEEGQSPDDIVSVGDEIEVFVQKVEDTEGNVLLSKRKADNRVVWERLEGLQKSGEPLEATVTERVKGGLLVDVGVRGFVPASHVARNYVENLDKYVGETLRLKVIELDRRRNNVVLSRKEVLQEEYESAKAETFSNLKEGSVVEGIVRRLTDFGAFVDIGGGIEGLLHVSEMAWSRVAHPSDVLSEGDKINVMVLRIDRERERISLSLKATLPDPWESVADRYHVGEVVNGQVTRVVDFGAFVKLEDGIEGLVHVSQMADYHVAKPSEVVSPGDEVEVRIVSLDEDARRIGLSIREAQDRTSQPQPSHESRRGGDHHHQSSSSSSSDSGSVKLGDVFENLGSFFDE